VESPRQADVVIVGIADEDMKTLPKPFPYPRSYYAHLVENLERCVVRAIAFDLTLDAPADSALMRSSMPSFRSTVTSSWQLKARKNLVLADTSSDIGTVVP